MNNTTERRHWDYPAGHVLPPRYVCTSVHTVEAGDTLYSLSQRYDVPVPILMQANRILNPYSLKVGQKICIPGSMPEDPVCMGILHVIVEGDTLYMIAKQHGVTLDALMEANPTIDPYNLRIGNALCVPAAPTSPMPPAPIMP